KRTLDFALVCVTIGEFPQTDIIRFLQVQSSAGPRWMCPHRKAEEIQPSPELRRSSRVEHDTDSQEALAKRRGSGHCRVRDHAGSDLGCGGRHDSTDWEKREQRFFLGCQFDSVAGLRLAKEFLSASIQSS